jgi:hypothetical protein
MPKMRLFTVSLTGFGCSGKRTSLIVTELNSILLLNRPDGTQLPSGFIINPINPVSLKKLKSMEENSIKALILDMDGVLWRGSDPIGDLPAIFKTIDEKGWWTGFLTNNATRTVDFYTNKLEQFGVQADESQVVTSAQATGEYLSRLFPGGGTIFVVGESGLVDILVNMVSLWRRTATGCRCRPGFDLEKLRRRPLLARWSLIYRDEPHPTYRP